MGCDHAPCLLSLEAANENAVLAGQSTGLTLSDWSLMTFWATLNTSGFSEVGSELVKGNYF